MYKKLGILAIAVILLLATGIGVGQISPTENINTNTNADYQAGKLAAYQEMANWATQMMAQLQGQEKQQTLEAPPLDITTKMKLPDVSGRYRIVPEPPINDTMPKLH